MNVNIVVKVPIDFATALNERLEAIKKVHASDVKRVIDANPDKLRELNERGRRFTLPHLVRLCLLAGADQLKLPDGKLMAKLADDPIVKGRPRDSGKKA